jgi:hypothetical protein
MKASCATTIEAGRWTSGNGCGEAWFGIGREW